MLSISSDGYIRIARERLCQIPLVHLMSGVDVGDSAVPSENGRSAVCGYTEWVSEGLPSLTIGWDWVLEGAGGKVQVVRIGEARHNVMCMEKGRDVGVWTTQVAVQNLIELLPWQQAVICLLSQPVGEVFGSSSGMQFH